MLDAWLLVSTTPFLVPVRTHSINTRTQAYTSCTAHTMGNTRRQWLQRRHSNSSVSYIDSRMLVAWPLVSIALFLVPAGTHPTDTRMRAYASCEGAHL